MDDFVSLFTPTTMFRGILLVPQKKCYGSEQHYYVCVNPHKLVVWIEPMFHPLNFTHKLYCVDKTGQQSYWKNGFGPHGNRGTSRG